MKKFLSLIISATILFTSSFVLGKESAATKHINEKSDLSLQKKLAIGFIPAYVTVGGICSLGVLGFLGKVKDAFSDMYFKNKAFLVDFYSPNPHDNGSETASYRRVINSLADYLREKEYHEYNGKIIYTEFKLLAWLLTEEPSALSYIKPGCNCYPVGVPCNRSLECKNLDIVTEKMGKKELSDLYSLSLVINEWIMKEYKIKKGGLAYCEEHFFMCKENMVLEIKNRNDMIAYAVLKRLKN